MRYSRLNINESTIIMSKNSEVNDTLHGTEHRVYIPYERLPINVINAFDAGMI